MKESFSDLNTWGQLQNALFSDPLAGGKLSHALGSNLLA